MADETSDSIIEKAATPDGDVLAGEGEDENLADAWGAALAEQGSAAEDMASQWAAMADENNPELELAGRGADRILSQEEIDNLLGFSLEPPARSDAAGIRNLIDSGSISYERLPMLEIVFDRLVRLSTTSLRNFTSDNVEVSIENARSVRFGDYLNSIELPSILGVFKAVDWDGFGLCTVDSALAFSVIEVLLGGAQTGATTRPLGRPFTMIESSLVRRMIGIILGDLEQAFAPLQRVNFQLERLETNPRFAAITRPANAATLVELRININDRGGIVQIMMPYATLEPVRGLLLQMVMGEKFGRDVTWETHLTDRILESSVEINAVLYETRLPLSRAMSLSVGDTLLFDIAPGAPVRLKCGEVELTRGIAGKMRENTAIRVSARLNPPQTTMADFENSQRRESAGKWNMDANNR